MIFLHYCAYPAEPSLVVTAHLAVGDPNGQAPQPHAGAVYLHPPAGADLKATAAPLTSRHRSATVLKARSACCRFTRN